MNIVSHLSRLVLCVHVAFCVTFIGLGVASHSLHARQFITADGFMTLLQHDSGLSTLLVAYKGDQLMTWTQTSAAEQVCVLQVGKELVNSYRYLYQAPSALNLNIQTVNASVWQEKNKNAFGWKESLKNLDYTRPSELLHACRENPVTRKTRSLRTRRSAFIMPDTKWCGRGNVANNFNETGESMEADKCCRTHDNCPEHITALSTYKGYRNWRPYTISSCECDDDFYLCLKDANRRQANQVGQMYFNHLKVYCFKIEKRRQCLFWYFPKVWCKKYDLVEVVQLYYPQVYT